MGTRPPHSVQVSRTQTGLVLLAVALLLQAIPPIEILGLLIGIVGAILMILGAPAFGPRHQGLVWASVGLYVVAEIIGLALGFSFAASLLSIGSASGSAAANAVLAAFDGLLVGAMVSICLIGISAALIAFALEDRIGKALLVAGVVADTVGAIVAFFYILEPFIRSVITRAFATDPPNMQVLTDGDAQLHMLWVPIALYLIGPLLFAASYGWAARLVGRRPTPPPVAQIS